MRVIACQYQALFAGGKAAASAILAPGDAVAAQVDGVYAEKLRIKACNVFHSRPAGVIRDHASVPQWICALRSQWPSGRSRHPPEWTSNPSYSL